MIGFWAYYGLIRAHIWNAVKANALGSLLAVGSSVVGVILLSEFDVNPSSQTWIRTIAGVAWPLGLLIVYLVFHALRAPWRLYDEQASLLIAANRRYDDTVSGMALRMSQTEAQLQTLSRSAARSGGPRIMLDGCTIADNGVGIGSANPEVQISARNTVIKRNKKGGIVDTSVKR